MGFLRRLRQYIEEERLLPQGVTVVLGVSGGPDSLCLLDILHKLSPEYGWKLHLAHLDHGWRPESAAEAEQVRALGESRSLAFHLARVDSRSLARARGESLEEAARHLRYEFLAQVARQVGAQCAAVAHTADDQAETVLMHFLRGSGLAGLRGMLPLTGLGVGQAGRLTVVRPLLWATRAEVEAHCAANGLQPLIDPSNQDRSFFRNRLRLELLPQLAAYNPNLRAGLNRTAVVAQGEYALLSAVLDELWRGAARVEPEAVIFDRARWLGLSAPARRALLRRAVAHLRPGLRDVDFTPLEAALRFSLRANPGRTCDLLGGLALEVSSEQVRVRPWSVAVAPPFEAAPQLTPQGELRPGWIFSVQPCAPDEAFPVAAGAWSVVIDAEAARAPLTLRARRPGDRLQPLGMGGRSMKVSDLMINARVPAAARPAWPLVVSAGAIAWVPGLRLDERFKVTSETRTALRLQFRKN